MVRFEIARLTPTRAWRPSRGATRGASSRAGAQHVLSHQYHAALGDEEALPVDRVIPADLRVIGNHATLIENAARDLAAPADGQARTQHRALDAAAVFDTHVIRQQRLLHVGARND